MDITGIKTNDISMLGQWLNSLSVLGLDVETTGLDPYTEQLVCFALTDGTNHVWFNSIGIKEHHEVIENFFLLHQAQFVGHNVKFDLHFIRQTFGVIPTKFIDSKMLVVLQNPEAQDSKDKGLKASVTRLFNVKMTEMSDFGLEERLRRGSCLRFKCNPEQSDAKEFIKQCERDKKIFCIHDVDEDTLRQYNVQDAYWALKIFQKLSGVSDYFEREQQITKILFHMEIIGIRYEKGWAQIVERQLLDNRQEILSKIVGESNGFFSSEKDCSSLLKLREYLTKCGATELTDKGFVSTSIHTIEKINSSANNPVLANLLEYKEVSKLLNTYSVNMSMQIDSNSIIHADFLQWGTKTGRLSCRNPNLQNLPKHGKYANLIKSKFSPANPGDFFAEFDYSQIELRVMAWLSNDPNLVNAYLSGTDLHKFIASVALGKPVSEITKEERQLGKTCNFAVAYGQSAKNLAEVVGIPVDNAKLIVEKLNAGFPFLTSWRKLMIYQAKMSGGYFKTAFGRKLYSRDLLLKPNYCNLSKLRMAERDVINNIVQGTAADIVKMGMIRLYDIGFTLVSQIHDAIILTISEDCLNTRYSEIKNSLESIMTAKTKIPFPVECSVGKNLGALEPFSAQCVS